MNPGNCLNIVLWFSSQFWLALWTKPMIEFLDKFMEHESCFEPILYFTSEHISTGFQSAISTEIRVKSSNDSTDIFQEVWLNHSSHSNWNQRLNFNRIRIFLLIIVETLYRF